MSFSRREQASPRIMQPSRNTTIPLSNKDIPNFRDKPLPPPPVGLPSLPTDETETKNEVKNSLPDSSNVIDDFLTHNPPAKKLPSAPQKNTERSSTSAKPTGDRPTKKVPQRKEMLPDIRSLRNPTSAKKRLQKGNTFASLRLNRSQVKNLQGNLAADDTEIRILKPTKELPKIPNFPPPPGPNPNSKVTPNKSPRTQITPPPNSNNVKRGGGDTRGRGRGLMNKRGMLSRTNSVGTFGNTFDSTIPVSPRATVQITPTSNPNSNSNVSREALHSELLSNPRNLRPVRKFNTLREPKRSMSAPRGVLSGGNVNPNIKPNQPPPPPKSKLKPNVNSNHPDLNLNPHSNPNHNSNQPLQKSITPPLTTGRSLPNLPNRESAQLPKSNNRFKEDVVSKQRSATLSPKVGDRLPSSRNDMSSAARRPNKAPPPIPNTKLRQQSTPTENNSLPIPQNIDTETTTKESPLLKQVVNLGKESPDSIKRPYSTNTNIIKKYPVRNSSPKKQQPQNDQSIGKPTRAPTPLKDLSRCRTSIYFGITPRQSIVLENLDKQWEDVESTVFASVVESSEEGEDDELLPELRESVSGEEARKALASMDIDIPEVALFNLEEPGEIETSRKMSHASVKPGVWEGWRRRVKRQTWEEWEQRMTYRSKPTLSQNREGKLEELPQARSQQELDGRQVTPYWLIHWWLTKNSTDRPTVSKHPLLELLLDNMNIVDALSSVITISTDLNKLAYALVCIFDGCGRVMQLITHFITKEIQSTSTSNTLLRTNSITTKTISSYAKIAGVPFIRKILSPLLQQLVDDNVVIEIDPKKLKESDNLEEQKEALLDLAQKILDTIIYSDLIPYTFHQISNCLSVMITEKFSQEATYFGIGGFIFLRFICPSIVAPEAFNLLKKSPPAPVRRTLVLVSKIIQFVANGAKHVKEKFMSDIALIFTERNSEPVKKFYDRLATIPNEQIDDPALIPVPLVEEALTIVHHLVILQIDTIKDYLTDIDEVEKVTYNVFENLSTVVLKSNIILESLRRNDTFEASSPLFKPYSLLIDVILADGCKIITTLLNHIPKTTDKEILAEALMCIVHEHGDSLNFVKILISKDISLAKDINSVLSGNSLSNLLFSGLLKVITRGFLQQHWGPIIQKVNTTNECMELDPPRAPQNFDFMKANENIALLAEEFISSLVNNQKDIHQQAREICAYVQKKLIEKFGNDKIGPHFSAMIMCERVFVPAVAFPTQFHLLKDVPEFHARRSFVLVSTVLRNCLHRTLCDEGYFVGLNHVVNNQGEKVNRFLDDISKPLSYSVPYQPTWEAQAGSLLVIHKWLSASLDMDSFKTSLKGVTNSETIVYNVFDRLAAVIALYRFRLRRRIASGEFGALSATAYSDFADKRHE